jgi:hypothetical protein
MSLLGRRYHAEVDATAVMLSHSHHPVYKSNTLRSRAEQQFQHFLMGKHGQAASMSII